MNYTYQIYGLTVQSEFLINAWILSKSANKEADLRFVMGYVELNGLPYETDHSIQKNTPEGWLYSIKDVVSFFVSDENIITIDVFSKKNELAESILLGPILTAVLIKKGYQVMHGVTLMKDNRAFLLTGISGVGKSSIAAAFSMRGYTVLSDQISVLKVSNDTTTVMTAKSNLKLWKDCLDQLNIDSTKLQKVRKELNKYYYPLVHEAIEVSYPLHGVFELKISPLWGRKLTAIEQNSLQGFKVINQNTAWKFLHTDLGVQSESFKNISLISSHVICKSIVRPYALYNILKLTDFIENQVSI